MQDANDPLHFESQADFAHWLAASHDKSDGVWLRHAKKGAAERSVTYQEALEVALCFGWIDGQRKGLDDKAYLQRWTPRRTRSIWSKVNREKALRYIEEGRMQPSGLAEVERARQDGRWDAAYDSVARRRCRRTWKPLSASTRAQPSFSPRSSRRTGMPCCFAFRLR